MKVATEINDFYRRTLMFLSKLEEGADVDVMTAHWVTMIDEYTQHIDTCEGYANAHITNLVNIIDNLLKELGGSNE